MENQRDSGLVPIRIAAHIDAGWNGSRVMTGGILRHASLHRGVAVRIFGNGEREFGRIRALRSWRPDGVIVGVQAPSPEELSEAGCRAAVFVNADAPPGFPLPYARVLCDNAAVAQEAAGHFTRKRLASCAFAGTGREMDWSREREGAFRAAVEAAGGEVRCWRPPRRRGIAAAERSLVRWLQALPKPCGLFADCDWTAKSVLDIAQEAGIPVPEQLQVLGVDNEEFVCNQTVPALSSVIPDFDAGGWAAAEALTALLRGGGAGAGADGTILFGVKGIVERASTQDARGGSRIVGIARTFLAMHAASDITVADVAKAAGASQRLLEMHFKTITGTTVARALQNERLRLVQEMLRTTNTPIARIGELCGFRDALWLKQLFRRRFGVSMREWRRGCTRPLS